MAFLAHSDQLLREIAVLGQTEEAQATSSPKN